MTNYAERRVLSLLFADQELRVDLKAEDFKFLWHQQIFTALASGSDVTAMGLPDDVKAYLVGLDEDWAPRNLGTFAAIVKREADQRRFADGVARLRK